MTHPLQVAWHDEANEQAYIAEITQWIQAGDLDRAHEKLLTDLQEIGSNLTHPAKSLSRKLEIDGWDEMVEAIVDFEGDPITAVHLMISNDTDLAFEDQEDVFEPELEIALYSDEFYAFSQADHATLSEESQLPDRPWFGQSEDIEAYLEILEMGNFNTLVLRHKRQHHFRDQQHELDRMKGADPNIVPVPYIEFMLAAMYRAVAYHILVRKQMEIVGLPNNIPVIAGMHNMKFEVSSVYFPKESKIAQAKEMADLVIPIKRNVIEEEAPVEATKIRKTVLEHEPEEKKVGFFKRLFRRNKEAA